MTPESTETPSAQTYTSDRDPRYLRLLMVLLSTATFFEGYDAAITAVVLRDLARDFGISTEHTSTLSGPIVAIGLGAFGALFITALGDRIGRRPLLIGTTIMYALFTGLTAAANSVPMFVLYQFLARSFLIAEYATAVTMVAEEFPAARRGRALGLLTALGAFGLPVVALSYLALQDTALGWRALYLVGLVPLLVVGVLRVKLRETSRWIATRAAGTKQKRVPLRDIVQGPHRGTLARVCLLFFFTHFGLLAASAWWPFYAGTERHFTQGTITLLLSTAYPLGVTGYFAAGRLQDRIGRRNTGALFLIAGLAFGIATFQVGSASVMFPVMTLAVFFGAGVNPVLNAVVSELFPTEIRATAVAVARSIFGTVGAIAGPLAVSLAADEGIARTVPWLPFLGNVGHSVTIAALMYIPAVLVLRTLPETAGRELESIAGADQAAHS